MKHPARNPFADDLSVGQVASRSGIAVSALHFYEAEGLIRSRRNAGNQRRYPREVLRRVAIIKVAQRTGIPLKTIREASRHCRRSARRRPKTGAGSRPPGRRSWSTASTG